VTTFGESHGKGVGCVIDGVPPRMRLTEEDIQVDLDRRRPGQSVITTPRKEEDKCEILSGVIDGVTLGTPIAVLVRNKDQKSQDYSEMQVAYRPSHADATYDFKYGIRAVAGGGRSSARETIGRVAAGAVAKLLLRQLHGTEVLAFVNKVRDISSNVDLAKFTLEEVESNAVRCPGEFATLCAPSLRRDDSADACEKFVTTRRAQTRRRRSACTTASTRCASGASRVAGR